jgi:IPT/TIG domain
MPTEQEQNELSVVGKIIAGALLIFFTILPGYIIVAYWPDRLADPKENVRPLYVNDPFHIRLACITDTLCCPDTMIVKKSPGDTTVKDTAQLPVLKTADTAGLDSLGKIRVIRAAQAAALQHQQQSVSKKKYYLPEELIHLNTLILILVAAAGFAGNMIHIATSFTTFTGAGEFKRSWLLWYFVRPFSASALAMGIYFVFRGGFLNMNNDSVNINLYGVMTISLLAGLFTDIATQKLKEVFETLFKPKDNRPDKLEKPEIKVNSVTPEKLVADKANTITIKGENFDKNKLVFKMNGETITEDKVTITANTITIQYTIPEVQADKTEFKLVIADEKGKELFAKTLGV